MNFSPQVKAWILLITMVLSSGIGVGYGAFLSGSNAVGSVLLGLAAAATNVMHALSASPKEKAAKAAKDPTNAPFPPTP